MYPSRGDARSPTAHPETIGAYRIVASRGVDGPANVYLAATRGSSGALELAIVRTLRRDLIADPKTRAFFIADGKLGLRLVHANIVRTRGAAEDGDVPYIATEYLDGLSLDVMLAKAAKASLAFDQDLCARIVADALAGLHYAHELREPDGTPLGIVHRNVSPHSIFLTYEGQVKLVDFGTGMANSPAVESDADALQRRVGYMAPEQVAGVAVDRRADVFAMGIVLWELLTGRPLMTRATTVATLQRLLHERLEAPSEILSDVDGELDEIVGKALDRDPARRFQTANEMLVALEARLFRRGVRSERFAAERIGLLFATSRDESRAENQRLLAALGAPAVGLRKVTLESARPSPPSPPEAQEAEPAPLPQPARPGIWPTSTAGRIGVGFVGVGIAAMSLLGARLVLFTPDRTTNVTKDASVGSLSSVDSGGVVPAPTPRFETVLRLHGSSTIGAELAPALAEAFFRQRGDTEIGRQTGKRPTELDITSVAGDKRESIEIVAEGSSTAFRQLAVGECDIGMASRAITPEESDSLRTLGDFTLPASEHLIGLDGIAVLVHPNNPLRSIDTNLLRGAFSGKFVDWASLGARSGPIDIYAPDEQSGTYDVFRSVVLGDANLNPQAKRFVDSAALVKAVISDPEALGLASFRNIASAEALALGEPGAIPLYPSPFTVATEDYILSRRLYFYTPPRPKTPLAIDFVKFAQSPEGQRIVKETGFVDLGVRISDPTPCVEQCPPRYAAISRRARRLSLTFRFRSSSSDFDSRSLDDIDRLITLLKTMTNPHVILLGFADIAGNPTASLTLSKERARKVNAELVARGIRPTLVDGFGIEMPRASNTTSAGRERNRRVEVWLDKE